VSGLVLSLFPGIGLLDMAFEEEGFCVVRGPDVLWGGDIKRFHPPAGKFDGVIGGPPCQAFSRLRHLVEHNGLTVAENLIPEFERCLREAKPRWFLMENVPQAPGPYLPGLMTRRHLVRDVWVGGVTNRLRAFHFGTTDGWTLGIEVEALCDPHPPPAVCASGGVKPGQPKGRRVSAKYLGWKTAEALKQSLYGQGLAPDFCDEMPFTLEGKHRVVGNGVPLSMGRAIARAVKRALTAGEHSRTVLHSVS
jgi:DNA (cytosine-5)-methyltransferase 1